MDEYVPKKKKCKSISVWFTTDATTESHVNLIPYIDDRRLLPDNNDMLQTTTKQLYSSYNSLITKTNNF